MKREVYHVALGIGDLLCFANKLQAVSVLHDHGGGGVWAK